MCIGQAPHSRWKPISDFVAAAMERARFSPYSTTHSAIGQEETRLVGASRVLAALEQSSGAEFIAALGERYAASSDFPDTTYVDSSEYDDLRAQISAPLDGGCTVSGESSR